MSDEKQQLTTFSDELTPKNARNKLAVAAMKLATRYDFKSLALDLAKAPDATKK